MTKEAENFIIERYQLDKCYRVDTEETRQYMSIDVHNDYEEEYQCYLAGAESREKRIEELEKENAELKKKLEIAQNVRGDWFGKAVTKDRQLTEANETLDYAKAIMRELLDNSNEYARQNAEDFIKE